MNLTRPAALVIRLVLVAVVAMAGQAQTLALTGAKIYTSPEAPPIANGSIVITDSKITAVGASSAIAIPPNAHVLDCKGAVITAGFQNSHVHFMESKWIGADVTKLFVGALEAPSRVNIMPLSLTRAAARQSHSSGRLVMAHPSSVKAIRVCLAAGVDILVHTTPQAGTWDKPLLAEMLRRKMSVIPTLQLWRYELHKAGVLQEVADNFVAHGVAQLAAFSAAGGQVSVGTDTGYMRDYDPSAEYTLMKAAGMSVPQILASLTTAPAARFNAAKRRGRIAPGYDADLVVLQGDPEEAVTNFARVRYTVRKGQIIYATK